MQAWTYHRSRSNERAVRIILKFLAVDIRALVFLPPEVLARGTSAQECTIEINSDDFVVMADLTVESRALCPWDTGVGDEDIKTAVELFDLLLHGSFERVFVKDVDLVGSACATQ